MAPLAAIALRQQPLTPLALGPAIRLAARSFFTSSTSKSEPSRPTHHIRRQATPASHPPPPGTRSLQVLRRETATTRPALFFAATAGTDHLQLTEPRVLKYFSRFGAIHDVRIAKDHVTCRPQPWGLVQFAAHALIGPRPAADLAGRDPIDEAIKAGKEVMIDGVTVQLRPAVIRLRRDNAVETGIDHCGFRGFAASYKVPYRPSAATDDAESAAERRV